MLSALDPENLRLVPIRIKVCVYVSGGFFVFKCVRCWVLSSDCAKSLQIAYATLKHGHFSSSPFISAHFLLPLPCLPVTGAPFKRTSLHFKRQRLPLPFLRLPHTCTRTQLSAAQILYIPWPSLPPLPELTPPQPRVVEKIIFYACHSSPHTDTAYERHTEPTLLPTFVCVWCTSLSVSRIFLCSLFFFFHTKLRYT